jgi:hypothetical protein
MGEPLTLEELRSELVPIRALLAQLDTMRKGVQLDQETAAFKTSLTDLNSNTVEHELRMLRTDISSVRDICAILEARITVLERRMMELVKKGN